jgi:hypothetical protein
MFTTCYIETLSDALRISRSLVEGMGRMLMPAISALFPLAGSIKFVQITGIIGK